MKLFLTRQKGAVCAPLLADFFQLIDQASQLLTGEAVDAVAELAGEVCPALLAQNVLQLLRAEGEQRALRALARAVAAVFNRIDGGLNLNINSINLFLWWIRKFIYSNGGRKDGWVKCVL